MGTSDGKDNSGLEVCVLKQANFRKNTAAVYSGFSSFNIAIPAHATKFDITATCDVTGNQAVTLLTTSPHAHKFAHPMKFTVVRASGETIVMHDGAFDFEEQAAYSLEKPLDIKAGDKVITTCTFDNPTDQTVTFGENTGNEMCFNFATYYPMNMLSCGGFGGFPGGAPMIPGF
jgi:hypothetical protein